MKKVEKLTRLYLEQSKIMHIATAMDNQPWIATVWFAHDSDLNLYWISQRDRRHSKELSVNAAVTAAIMLPVPRDNNQKVQGLQVEGYARAAEPKFQKQILELYRHKFKHAKKYDLAMLQDDNGEATFYMLAPRSFILFDEVHYPKNPRQEWWLKA